MHKALIKLLTSSRDELMLYIASDMNFDRMDKSLNTNSTYNYRAGPTGPPLGKTSSQIWETTQRPRDTGSCRITRYWMVYHNINTAQWRPADQNFKGVILQFVRQVIKVLLKRGRKEAEKGVVDGVKTDQGE